MTESIYLNRYAWPYELFPSYAPPSDLGMIVVIPAFKEPAIEVALESLNATLKPKQGVLVIIIVNESEHAEEEVRLSNQKCIETIRKFHSKYELLYSYQEMPHKKAGVGLARKIGMDEAVRIFGKSGNDGVIVCYDADCRCDDNYLIEIERHYSDSSSKAGIIFYEHQLHGDNHREILNYELYLRYYIDALRFTGFPYAYQTLGSCITVRSSQYEKVGGMNTRKAGEDFYFLNKTIPLGGFREINSTTIRPSDRISDRVPFGTGKAVNELKDLEEYEVYHPNTFEDLRLFIAQLDSFWGGEKTGIPMSIESFLGNDWTDQIAELKNQVNSKDQFQSRFFHWLNAFKILKFIHFARDHFYQNVTLEEAMEWLRAKNLLLKGSLSSQLIQLRFHDRNFPSSNS